MRTNPFYDQFASQLFNLYPAKLRESGFAVFANFPLPRALEIELSGLCKFILSCSRDHCRHTAALQQLAARQRACLRIFRGIVHGEGVPESAASRFVRRGLSMLDDDAESADDSNDAEGEADSGL